jgi:pimeloyl-ACP methyl ester carboxylesterase
MRATHRCHVPTMPLGSHHRAMRAEADLSPTGMADLVVEIADALGLDRFVLVANDSGGAVSQLVAVRHPERLRALVLTNCDALEVFPPLAYAYFMSVARRPALGAWMLRAMSAMPVLGLAPLAFGSLSPRVTREDVRAWTEPGAVHAGVREDLAKFARGASRTVTLEAAEALARRPVPLYLVWGAADPFFTASLAKRLAAKVPGAKLTLVPNARTYAMLDAPDAVVEGIRDAIDQTAGNEGANASPAIRSAFTSNETR